MIRKIVILAAAAATLAGGCNSLLSLETQGAKPKPKTMTQIPDSASTLVLAAGCFWCIEAQLEDLIGVYEVEAGYAGGRKPNPTYAEVCSGLTGHAEVVKVYFDAKQIAADDILRIFFAAHDPTTLNRQGPDVGTQYRSAVFYSTPEERALAERIKKEIETAKIWKNKIVTTIEPLTNYTKAEDYHQDYFLKYELASDEERSRMNPGYCAAVVEPKVRKFRQQFAAKLKKKP